jgi:ferredoxin
MRATFQRIYGSQLNPTFQSGVLAVFFLGVALVTGLILVFFYKVGDPYGSLASLQANPFLYWLRSLHRYSSDAAVLAVLVHILKMGYQARAFGPRVRAWVSGVALTLMMLVIGVSGLMMVWDSLAQRLALASVRMVELLPLFSEPPRRILADQNSLGNAFFFMLMFLHVALPLVLAFMLWFHTSRLARAVFLPEKAVAAFWGPVLLVVSLLFPAPLGSQADLGRLPGAGSIDVWYAFWLPLEEWAGGAFTVLAMGALFGLLAAYPLLRRPEKPPLPSHADEALCDGCTQCFQDCPYDAISMVPRSFHNDGRHSELVALVDPDLCVSCGICAGSCKPMGVGPPKRTGRDQMKAMESLIAGHPIGDQEVVVLACGQGCGLSPQFRDLDRVRLVPTGCSGSLHTSVMELFLRRGAIGVMVISCPSRDCTNREGPKWLEQRVYHDREAELMARVDRRRVRLHQATRAQGAEAARAALEFAQELRAMEPPAVLEEVEVQCVTPTLVT